MEIANYENLQCIILDHISIKTTQQGIIKIKLCLQLNFEAYDVKQCLLKIKRLELIVERNKHFTISRHNFSGYKNKYIVVQYTLNNINKKLKFVSNKNLNIKYSFIFYVFVFINKLCLDLLCKHYNKWKKKIVGDKMYIKAIHSTIYSNTKYFYPKASIYLTNKKNLFLLIRL